MHKRLLQSNNKIGNSYFRISFDLINHYLKQTDAE